MWECLCDCGNAVVVYQSNITSGHSQSCGCLGRENSAKAKVRHGLPKTHPVYAAWRSMMNRCYTTSSTSYPNYGGRGIGVCRRWRDSLNFIKDMSPTYSDGLTLERADTDGGYSPDNCRWVSVAEQNRNKRNNIKGEIDGKVLCLSEAVEQYGSVPYGTAWNRLRKGWSFHKAVTLPLRSRKP